MYPLPTTTPELSMDEKPMSGVSRHQERTRGFESVHYGCAATGGVRERRAPGVVGRPATSMLSFTPNGSPWSGRSGRRGASMMPGEARCAIAEYAIQAWPHWHVEGSAGNCVAPAANSAVAWELAGP